MSKPMIDFVSFGGEYEKDLKDYWVCVAAKKCGMDLKQNPEDFLGMRQPDIGMWGYHNFFDRFQNGAFNWNITQVEDHALYMPETLGIKNFFASFPKRIINGLPCYLQDPRGLPAAQGACLLVWHKDRVPSGIEPTWEDFFDLEKIPGKRTIRDFPTSTIELALLSMDRNVEEVLYDESLSKAEIEVQVHDALKRLESIHEQTIWWTQGYNSSNQLTDNGAVMGALWNRNWIKANMDLCPNADLEDWVFKANPSTAILITDWFVIIAGSGNQEAANQLLECMYNDEEVLESAAKYCSLQGNVFPVEGITFTSPTQRHSLEVGTWKNNDATLMMNTKFWGKHFNWIGEIWKQWRVEFGGTDPGGFIQSPPPPKQKAEIRDKLESGS